MRAQRASKRVAWAVMLTAPLFVACGNDSTTGPNNNNGGTGPTTSTIIGNWVATSMTAPTQPQWGDAVKDDGLTVGVTFDNSGNYAITVSGDDPADPWICPGSASCTFAGTYSASGTGVVFDQGTADQTSASYALSGDQLTLTFAAAAGIPDPYRIVLRRS